MSVKYKVEDFFKFCSKSPNFKVKRFIQCFSIWNKRKENNSSFPFEIRVEWMGLNFYDYRGFQSKITIIKHIWGKYNLLNYTSCTIIFMIWSIIPHQIGIGKFGVSWYCASIAAPNAFGLPGLLPFNLLQFPSQVPFIYYVGTGKGRGVIFCLLSVKFI